MKDNVPKTILSNVERQRRRRAKLLIQKEEDKFAPEQFIALAIQELLLEGELDEDICKKIINCSNKKVESVHKEIVHAKYAKQLIYNYLKK